MEKIFGIIFLVGDIKMKKITKKWIMIIGIIMISCVLLVGIERYIKIEEKNRLEEIKKRYHTTVEVICKTELYEKIGKKYVKRGSVEKGVSFILEKETINSSRQTYFQIKGSNYYLYYQDVKKKDYKEREPFSYILFNSNVVTEKKTECYQNGKWIFTLDTNVSLPLMYMDETYYYVTYLDQVVGIKKTQAKLLEHENSKDIITTYIPVLHYGKIYQEGETCKENTCISNKQLEMELATLKEQGFYPITISEFKNWLMGNIHLKEKAVLLTLQQESNLKEEEKVLQLLSNDTSLKFVDSNQKVVKGAKIDAIPRYVIKNNTDLDRYKKMLQGEEVKEPVFDYSSKVRNLSGNATQIPVLNYHFFYDRSIGESCGQTICLDVAKFEEQLKYLKENGWKTLSMEEFRAWMYGEIELPGKSVLLTIDDGGIGTGFSNGNKLIPLLEKYQSHATIFLITAWYFPPDYQSPYLDIESHTNEMHTEGYCSGVLRGAQLLCSSRDEVLNDLKSSIAVTGSTKAFCYPFYAYNDTAIELVRESGFQLAFAGGSYKATRNSHKYAIPRYPIGSNITLDSFIRILYS